MSNRRVPKKGIVEDSTCPSSKVSPVRISRAARRTVSGFMWLPAPRSSPGPHFEGQRALSAGGCQDCAWTVDVPAASAAAAAMTAMMGRMDVTPVFESSKFWS